MLLLVVVLQVVDSLNLGVSGNGVNSAFFTLFAEIENLVGNLIVGFLIVSIFEKLLLDFYQFFVNAISIALLSFSDNFSNILL